MNIAAMNMGWRYRLETLTSVPLCKYSEVGLPDPMVAQLLIYFGLALVSE